MDRDRIIENFVREHSELATTYVPQLLASVDIADPEPQYLDSIVQASRLVLVTGPPGSGKSTNLRAFAYAATQTGDTPNGTLVPLDVIDIVQRSACRIQQATRDKQANVRGEGRQLSPRDEESHRHVGDRRKQVRRAG